MTNQRDIIENLEKWLTNQPLLKQLQNSISNLEEAHEGKFHFIYELIQNADDQEASNITFEIKKDRIIIAHNGNPIDVEKEKEILEASFKKNMNPADSEIMGLCGSQSTKVSKKEKIGSFGVGFKSVYTITNMPEVHSGGFHFRINKVVPEWVREHPTTDSLTVFVLPLSQEELSEREFSKFSGEYMKHLREELIRPELLLFLRHMEEIKIVDDRTEEEWSVKKEKLKDGRTRITDNLKYNKLLDETYWRVLSKNLKLTDETLAQLSPKKRKRIDQKGMKEVEVSIFIKLKKDRIEELSSGELFNFLPIDEDTKLKFGIHSPGFIVTSIREGLAECGGWDAAILEKSIDCFIKALNEFKEDEINKYEMYNLIPNRTLFDKDSNNFGNLMHSFLWKMNERVKEEDIIWTKQNKWVKPNKSMIDDRCFDEIFSLDEMKLMFSRGYMIPKEVAKVLPRYLPEQLDIMKIDYQQILDGITANDDYFKLKDPTFFRKLYQELDRGYTKINGADEVISSSKILLTEKQEFVSSIREEGSIDEPLFFTTQREDIEKVEEFKEFFSLIHPKLTIGKENGDIRSFLTNIGVSKLTPVNLIEWVLLSKLKELPVSRELRGDKLNLAENITRYILQNSGDLRDSILQDLVLLSNKNTLEEPGRIKFGLKLDKGVLDKIDMLFLSDVYEIDSKLIFKKKIGVQRNLTIEDVQNIIETVLNPKSDDSKESTLIKLLKYLDDIWDGWKNEYKKTLEEYSEYTAWIPTDKGLKSAQDAYVKNKETYGIFRNDIAYVSVDVKTSVLEEMGVRCGPNFDSVIKRLKNIKSEATTEENRKSLDKCYAFLEKTGDREQLKDLFRTEKLIHLGTAWCDSNNIFMYDKRDVFPSERLIDENNLLRNHRDLWISISKTEPEPGDYINFLETNDLEPNAERNYRVLEYLNNLEDIDGIIKALASAKIFLDGKNIPRKAGGVYINDNMRLHNLFKEDISFLNIPSGRSFHRIKRLLDKIKVKRISEIESTIIKKEGIESPRDLENVIMGLIEATNHFLEYKKSKLYNELGCEGIKDNLSKFDFKEFSELEVEYKVDGIEKKDTIEDGLYRSHQDTTLYVHSSWREGLSGDIIDALLPFYGNDDDVDTVLESLRSHQHDYDSYFKRKHIPLLSEGIEEVKKERAEGDISIIDKKEGEIRGRGKYLSEIKEAGVDEIIEESETPSVTEGPDEGGIHEEIQEDTSPIEKPEEKEEIGEPVTTIELTGRTSPRREETEKERHVPEDYPREYYEGTRMRYDLKRDQEVNEQLVNLYHGSCQFKDCEFFETYFSSSRNKIIQIFKAKKIDKMHEGAPQGDLGNTLSLCPNHSEVMDRCDNDLLHQLSKCLLEGTNDINEITFTLKTPTGTRKETIIYDSVHLDYVKDYLSWIKKK